MRRSCTQYQSYLGLQIYNLWSFSMSRVKFFSLLCCRKPSLVLKRWWMLPSFVNLKPSLSTSVTGEGYRVCEMVGFDVHLHILTFTCCTIFVIPSCWSITPFPSTSYICNWFWRHRQSKKKPSRWSQKIKPESPQEFSPWCSTGIYTLAQMRRH